MAFVFPGFLAAAPIPDSYSPTSDSRHIFTKGLTLLASAIAPLKSVSGTLEFYATCSSGLESLLAEECRQSGYSKVQTAGAGVRFSGTLRDGYHACLWSRLANRVLLPVHRGPASDPDELYSLVQSIDWSEHLSVDGSLAVDFFTANSAITHSQFGALKVKDAVVDQFRQNHGRRPDVDRETPDVRINVYLYRDSARIAIDLSGSSLHRRGYRSSAGLAPLKENLAAALLVASDWPSAIEKGYTLLDPMCGSGTLLIEAAMIAKNQAPGLSRHYFGFSGWQHHQPALWESLLQEAQEAIRPSPVAIVGTDQDEQVLASCEQNISKANCEEAITLHCQPLSSSPPESLADSTTGYLITNPPYGERLAGDTQFYASMGGDLSRHYAGWDCALFTASAAPYARARLPLSVRLKTKNGGIDCILLTGQIPAVSRSSAARSIEAPEHPQAGLYRGRSDSAGSDPAKSDANLEGVKNSSAVSANTPEVDATAFVNRVRKNQRALKGWLKQNQISAYRLYDADLPEFAVAIDVFGAEGELYVVVQEYQAPATVNVVMASARLEAVLNALPGILQIPDDHIHLKVRQKKTDGAQYEKHVSARSVTIDVQEQGATLELNLTDYLDTGLFLDHRPVRRYIHQNAKDKRFLNLFAYTATATVAAVTGGAASSVSVDSSNRYCQWAKRNLDRNGAAAQRHEVVRQDVFTWLEAASLGISDNQRFDLVLLDPPTYSNSTDLEADWDVQRDHVKAIDACLSIMSPGGLLIFSNNFRRFKMDKSLVDNTNGSIRVEERNRWSVDRDFHRNPRVHQCWFVYKNT